MWDCLLSQQHQLQDAKDCIFSLSLEESSGYTFSVTFTRYLQCKITKIVIAVHRLMTVSAAVVYVETHPPVIWTGKTRFECIEMSLDGWWWWWTGEKIRRVKRSSNIANYGLKMGVTHVCKFISGYKHFLTDLTCELTGT